MSNLDGILLTGERRQWVENGLLPRVARLGVEVQIKLRDVRTFNDLDEVAKFAQSISREIQECHDNWRQLDGARKDRPEGPR